MPVIPSFSSFAQTPNLAQAWLGGQELQVEKQKIAQQAAEAAARINLGYAQLRNQAEQTAMEWNARKEIAGQEALRRQQEMEFEKAYQQQRMGLAEQELNQQQKKLQLDVDAATRRMTAKAVFDREKSRLMAEQVPEIEAVGRAAIKAGPDLGMAPSIITEAMQQPKKYFQTPQEKVGPSGTVYQQKYEGGPVEPVSRADVDSVTMPQQTKDKIADARKELATLKEQDAKAEARFVAMADKVMAGDLKDYNRQGNAVRGAVDGIIARRKRIIAMETELGQLYPTNQATAPPRILRKTPK